MKARLQRIRVALGLIGIVAVSICGAAPVEAAVTPSEFLTNVGSGGKGAGQFFFVSDIAVSPVNGHIFALDSGSNRVEEFTAWGNFVKAFGWDVAPGAVNEQQEIVVKATGGQFRLSFGASTTGDLEHDAAPGEVAAALNGLPTLSGGAVSVEAGPSDATSTRYVVVFSGGALAGANVSQLAPSEGTTPLSGGTPSSSIAVQTRADGTPGGTGLESCTAESGCKAGSPGTGAGQIFGAFAIAIDSTGDIYLRESVELSENPNQRVQKFDPAGHFLLTLGREVNKTTKANICTAADETAGEKCGFGAAGTASGEFSGGTGVALNAAGNLLVADRERIQEFNSEGTFLSSIAFPEEVVKDLAVDQASGNLFITSSARTGVSKLTPEGAELCSFSVAPRNGSFAVGPGEEVYMGELSDIIGFPHAGLQVFSGGCPPSAPTEFTFEETPQETTVDHNVGALATNAVGDLLIYRQDLRSEPGNDSSHIQIYGPPPVEFEPPPQVPPTIVDQYASSVNPEDATVNATINPHFWNDTRYYVEYGLGKCSEGGCEQTKPVAPGAILSKSVNGVPVAGAGVLLEGLQPGTVYHYRIVAQSGGGGPVRGVGGEVGSDGTESTLRTTALPRPSDTCPNQAFRTGPSAALSDCRAYEMVSPVDKNNGDIRDLVNPTGFRQGIRQSSLDGNSLAYSSYRAFADPASGPISVEYLARRGNGGWASESLMHTRSGSVFGSAAATEPEFKAFSKDLCSSWFVDPSPQPYAPGGVENFPNLLKRENCPAAYEAITTVNPDGPLPKQYLQGDWAELQGFSANGKKAIFTLPFMVADTATAGKTQLYEASQGGIDLVCVLPDGTPLGDSCSAGTGASDLYVNGRGAMVTHAISEDGSRIYWSDRLESPGKIYLRLNGSTTLPVSGTQSAANAQFWGASADGSSAIFSFTEKSKAGELYRYSLEAEASEKIAGQVVGVAGASDDLASVYFVSKEAMGGANSGGETASPGVPNLYLNREGANTFIGTLAVDDVETEGGERRGHYSDVSPHPVYHVARATPDGGHLVFISSRSLTGSSSNDVNSGKADIQVFQYAASTGDLNCISCNPGGARPSGQEVIPPAGSYMWIAGLVPAPLNQLYAPRVQSDDGNRVFFESYDSLVSRDTNGKADVYEWERAGAGECSESLSTYSPINGGCVSLISNGTNPFGSELVDSSSDGRDVFFTTDASLLPQDPGLVDLYDARAGGGFPAPPSAPAACEGEACQGPLSSPDDPTPASSTFNGAGNVNEKTASRKKHGKARKKKTTKKKITKKKQAKRQAGKKRGSHR